MWVKSNSSKRNRVEIQGNTKVYLFLIVLTGLLSLLAVPLLPAETILIATLTLLPAWFFLERRDFPRSYSLLWLILTLGFVLGTLAEMIISHRSPLTTLPLQLIVLQIGRLFTLRYRHSLFQCWLISLAMVVVAALVGYTFLLFLDILAFLVLTVIFLSMLTIVPTPSTKPSYPLKTILSLVVAGCVMTLFIFLALPRRSTFSGLHLGGRVSPVSGTSVSAPGFTRTLYLNSIRTLTNNENTALEVAFKQSVPTNPLYFRGTALNWFDGFSWNSSPVIHEAGIPAKEPTLRVSRFKKKVPENITATAANGIEYTLNYVGVATNRVFYLPRMMALAQMNSPLSRDAEHGYRLRVSTINEPLSIYSDMGTDKTIPDFPETLTDHEKSRYLSLPSLDEIDKITELSTRIASTGSNDYQQARALSQYLYSTYTYSLDSNVRYGKNVVSDFLFTSQRGHCELFATALAVMLRTRDIPSRLAVGFLVEPTDKHSSTVIVKNKHAHAWVEAYCDEKGWYRFDPTPPAPLTVSTHNMMFTNIMRYCDRVSGTTRHFISNSGIYIQRKAVMLISGIARTIIELFPSRNKWQWFFSRLSRGVVEPSVLVFMVLIAVFDAAIIRLYLKIRRFRGFSIRRRGKRRIVVNPVTFRMYRSIAKWLGVRSWKNAANKTLLEIAEQYNHGHPAFYQKAVRVIASYYNTRFGSPEDIRTAEKDIKRIMKSTPRPS